MFNKKIKSSRIDSGSNKKQRNGGNKIEKL